MKAAVVQAAPVGFDREATLDKAERLVAEAAATWSFFRRRSCRAIRAG